MRFLYLMFVLICSISTLLGQTPHPRIINGGFDELENPFAQTPSIPMLNKNCADGDVLNFWRFRSWFPLQAIEWYKPTCGSTGWFHTNTSGTALEYRIPRIMTLPNNPNIYWNGVVSHSGNPNVSGFAGFQMNVAVPNTDDNGRFCRTNYREYLSTMFAPSSILGVPPLPGGTYRIKFVISMSDFFKDGLLETCDRFAKRNAHPVSGITRRFRKDLVQIGLTGLPLNLLSDVANMTATNQVIPINNNTVSTFVTSGGPPVTTSIRIVSPEEDEFIAADNQWHEVTYAFRVGSGQFSGLTIGNFENYNNNWNLFREKVDDPQPGGINVPHSLYFLVDDVSIEEVTFFGNDRNCINDCSVLKTKLRKVANTNNQCCYELDVSVRADACSEFNTINLATTISPNPFSNTISLDRGLTRTISFCVPQSSQEKTVDVSMIINGAECKKTITIPSCECSFSCDNFTVSELTPTSSPSVGVCCYNLKLKSAPMSCRAKVTLITDKTAVSGGRVVVSDNSIIEPGTEPEFTFCTSTGPTNFEVILTQVDASGNTIVDASNNPITCLSFNHPLPPCNINPTCCEQFNVGLICRDDYVPVLQLTRADILNPNCNLSNISISSICGTIITDISESSSIPSVSSGQVKSVILPTCCTGTNVTVDFLGNGGILLCRKMVSIGGCCLSGPPGGGGIPKASTSGTEKSTIEKNGCIGNISVIPTPANEHTSLRVIADNSGNCTVRIMDIQGREVYTLSSQKLVQGTNDISLDKLGIENGTYFVRVEAGECIYATKFIMLK